MTQDDEHMIGRLRHEARVRWTTSADGKKGWKPDDVRSAVILDAAAFIEKQSERIFDLEKAAEMLRVAEIDNAELRKKLEETRARLREYTGDHHTINAARRGDPSGVQTPSEGHLE